MKFLNYTFKDESLLERALTHGSKSENNYERLEFLGDSILDFLVADYFYKECKDGEGKLTVLRSNYVSENYLSKIFDRLKLAKFVKLGKSYQGEISKAIKGDIVEAILAAIYIDGGIEEARRFILNHFNLEDYKQMDDENYKSRLQELIQGNFKCKMSYQTLPCENGFTSTFFMDEDAIATGEGKSKLEAEQLSAKRAIEKLFLITTD